MIDEELYVLATQELNSDRRRADLWDRAIALASDDHDEARYLYTNLRVEELVEERKAAELREQVDENDSAPASEPGTPTLSDNPLSGDDLEFEDMSPTAPPAAPDVSWMNLKDEVDPGAAAGGIPSPIDEEHPRIANQTSLFIDGNGSAEPPELDPLERTEPEGFVMADDSMELTAPDDLPPVNLDPDLTEAPDSSADSSLDSGHLESTQDISDDEFDTNMTGNMDDIPLPEAEIPATPIDNTEAVAGVAAATSAAAAAGVQPPLKAGPAYRVLEHRDGSRAAVKMGKSLPAMLVTLPWLLSKRLWGTAIVYLLMAAVLLFGLLSTGLGLLDAGDSASLQQKLVFAGFALLALIGLLYLPWSQGNSWIAGRLMRQGYRPKLAVNAQTARDALDIAR